MSNGEKIVSAMRDALAYVRGDVSRGRLRVEMFPRRPDRRIVMIPHEDPRLFAHPSNGGGIHAQSHRDRTQAQQAVGEGQEDREGEGGQEDRQAKPESLT